MEHPVRAGWKMTSGTPVETSRDFYCFRVPVEPKQTTTLVVEEVRPVETEYRVTSLTDDQVAVFLRDRTINGAVEQALRAILTKKSQVAGIERQMASRQAESNRIAQDQQRIRENMKALKGSAEEKALVQRYTRRLDEQESRLDALTREFASLTEQRQEAQAELDKLVEALSLDVALGG